MFVFSCSYSCLYWTITTSLQNTSCSVRLDGEGLWTTVFRCCHRISAIFRSDPFELMNMLWSEPFQLWMFWVVGLLEGEILPWTRVFCSLEQVFFHDCSVNPFVQPPCTLWMELERSGDAQCRTKCWAFRPKFSFGLIWTASCMLWQTANTFYGFLSTAVFFSTLFHEQQICMDYSWTWTCGQIVPELWSSSTRETLGLLALPQTNALLARSVSLGGRPCLYCSHVILVPFSFDEHSSVIVQRLGYCFITSSCFKLFSNSWVDEKSKGLCTNVRPTSQIVIRKKLWKP